MLPKQQAKASGKRPVRFPGICKVAADLGVSRIHLYFVLNGDRRSPRIERSPEFKQLQRAQAAVARAHQKGMAA